MHPVLAKTGISTILIFDYNFWGKKKHFLIRKTKLNLEKLIFCQNKSQVLNPVQANAFSLKPKTLKQSKKKVFETLSKVEFFRKAGSSFQCEWASYLPCITLFIGLKIAEKD